MTDNLHSPSHVFDLEENPHAALHEAYTRRLIDATPKDDLELIRQRVAEREKTRASSVAVRK